LSKNNIKTRNRILQKSVMSEEKILVAFYEEYYPHINSYIASRVNWSADADDLTQDVFIEFWKANRLQNPKAYIFAIARKIITQYYGNKEKQPRTVQLSSIGEITANPGLPQSENMAKQIYLLKLKKIIIEEVVGQLPTKAYEAIKLRFIEGLCSKEAAQKAGCSMDAFRKRLRRAVRILQKIREKERSKKGNVTSM